MNNSQLNIEQLLSNPSLKEFQSIGLIDERALRNYLIRYEYQELRKTRSQLSAIFFLSDKYHISSDTVNSILFRKQQNKLPLFSLSN